MHPFGTYGKAVKQSFLFHMQKVFRYTTVYLYVTPRKESHNYFEAGFPHSLKMRYEKGGIGE